jgi:hypothetical protein
VSDDGRVVAAGDHVVRVWHVSLDEPIGRPVSDPVLGNLKDSLHNWEQRLGFKTMT